MIWTALAVALAAGPALPQAGVQLIKVDLSVVAKGYRISKLVGATVINDKNEKIGTIDDVVADKDKKQLSFAVLQVGGFLGVWLGGIAFERTGSYNSVWWLSVLFGLLSAVINLPIVEKPVARAAADDTTKPGVLQQLDSVQIVYCQTWQYDDAVARLADRLGVDVDLAGAGQQIGEAGVELGEPRPDRCDVHGVHRARERGQHRADLVLQRC